MDASDRERAARAHELVERVLDASELSEDPFEIGDLLEAVLRSAPHPA